MKTKKIDMMLLANFVVNLLCSMTYPYIHQYIMANITGQLISLDSIITCIGTIIAGMIWNKWGKKLFYFYPHFCVIESILNIAVVIYFAMTWNVIAFYLLRDINFAFVTRHIISGGIRLRAIRYTTEDARSEYDNNDNSIYSIATIIGSVIALKLDLPIMVMIIISAIGNTLDNVFYIGIYYSEMKKRKTKEGDYTVSP